MIKLSNDDVEKIIRNFGGKTETLYFIGGGDISSDGVLYGYKRDNMDLVIKIMELHGEDAQQTLEIFKERANFVYFLAEQGVPIVNPIKNKNGSILEQVKIDDYNLVCYEMRKIDGNIQKWSDYDDTLIKQYGKVLGKFHAVTKLYPKWKGSALNGDFMHLGWLNELESWYNRSKDADIKKCWLDMKDKLSHLEITRDNFGFVHNDPHSYNIMLTKDGLFIIDFDVANFHWFANDLAIASQSLLWSIGGLSKPFTSVDPLKKFYEQFLKGYETENRLKKADYENIPLFIDYRRILMYTIAEDGWFDTRPDEREVRKNMIMDSPKISIL